MSRSWRSIVIAGSLLVGTGGCFIYDQILAAFDPCPDGSSAAGCQGGGMGEAKAGGVGVDLRDPISFSWDGVGADSLYVLRDGIEIWAIRPTHGSAKLLSPLIYASHPANSVSYVDSVAVLTHGPVYQVVLKRNGLIDRSTGFLIPAP